jgi:hypothetical protein
MRITFICHMLFLLAIMLGVSFAIHADFFSQVVLWGVFVYIIGKELLDEYRLHTQPERDARLRAQIMEKLNQAIDKVKKIV